MASLIDELISVLSEENEEYRELIKISTKKTGVIVKEDLEQLREITAKEQEHTGTLINLEKKREEVTSDIAMVLNRKESELTVRSIINILDGQKEVQARLIAVHDDLNIP